MMVVPSLDTKCGKYFRFRDLIECGETYRAVQPDNTPKAPETYEALRDLTRVILDPTSDQFGNLELSYGVSCPALYRKIRERISPSLDQHSAHELNSKGQLICSRGGAAVDFSCPGICSLQLAQWIVKNCGFDRVYFYGINRPIHVSVGPAHSAQIMLMRYSKDASKRIPRKISIEKFLVLSRQDDLVMSCVRQLGQGT